MKRTYAFVALSAALVLTACTSIVALRNDGVVPLNDGCRAGQAPRNPVELGIAWTPPYTVTVPKLKGKGNALEIEVVNLWPNRLIGDAALPPERRIANTSTSANPFDKNHPLLPSGLYSPVRVIWTETTNE